MTREQFNTNVKMAGVYMAALMANMAGVPMAQTQLWLVSSSVK